ncbi:MAG: cytidylate kinase family protein [Patescibacteria group bacterium]
MGKITIFGQAGTGTTSVGENLAKALGYKFLSSGNLFRSKAEELGIEFYKFEKFCQRNPKYDLEIDKTIATFGKKNNSFVVESRLAYHFIPDSLKIKLTCDYITRIRRVAGRDGIAFSAASEKTNFREDVAKKRYRKLYGIKDFGSDKKFDLIADTSRKSAEEIAAMIISKFKLPFPFHPLGLFVSVAKRETSR